MLALLHRDSEACEVTKAARRLCGAIVMALGAGLGAQHTVVYEEALARYKECIDRLPFVFQTEGRTRLAETGRLEALEILIHDYATAKDHTEHARYTLADLFGKHFRSEEALAPFAKLRASFHKPVDVWMWARTLAVQTDYAGDSEALSIAAENKDPRLRAAAIHALGHAKRADLGRAILEACIDLPKRDGDRAVLIGAMSSAIDANRGRTGEESFRRGLSAYANLLADDLKLPRILKVEIARTLMRILRGPALFLEPEPWLVLIERGEVKVPDSTHTVVKPRFFGIESDGERFCYVIDMSDSMCREISPEMRPKGPITGPRKRPKGVLPDENDIPWHKVKTRFDLAREQLRISLARLSKEKSFCIVWFGDEAGTLDATRGLVRATAANVRRAMAELDAIEPGKPEPVKAPDGRLRGGTNMHAGLRLAFALASKGPADEPAYVDPKPLTEGCDTIFLLSDGEPSWDDFHVEDKDYGEGRPVINAEYGAAAPRTPRMVYWGPYHAIPWLPADVVRMNAFRNVTIHAIGIGEANRKLLDELARIGNGQSFDLGRG
ncbi:MAG: hypothetical protein Fur0037_10340 [Planctomycetota bacterium]